MTIQSFFLIFISVCLSATAQTSFKYGLSNLNIPASAALFEKVFSMLFSPFVLGGLSLYAVGTVLWLFALRQVDLSLAYPFVSISFLLVFASGILFLGEPISVMKVAGLLFIVTGLVVLSQA